VKLVGYFNIWVVVIKNYCVLLNWPCKMGSCKLVVEVHYVGKFDWRFGCEYLGGQVEVHRDSVGLDKLSYFEIEDIYIYIYIYICKKYGYR